jgi:hypothetical protein
MTLGTAILGLSVGCLDDDVDEGVFVFDQDIQSLRINSDSANVTIAGIESDRTRVDVTRWWVFDPPRILVSLRQGMLEFGYVCLDAGGCLVDFDARVPADVDVTIVADSGDSLVTSMRGNVTVVTDRGELSGLNLESPQTVVETESGDVRLEYQTAPVLVWVTTADADVGVVVPPGSYALDLRSEIGEISTTPDIELDPAAESRIVVATATGNISLGTRPSE